MQMPTGSWVRWLLTLGWISVGVAPVTSAVAMARGGWTPVIDNALIASMTVDSTGIAPPLVGMPTSLGLEAGVPMSHPGPLGFWLLAPTTKVLGEPGYGLLVGAVLVTLASLAGIALVLRRRNDLVLEVLALPLVAVMVASLGGEILASPLNTHVGLLPLLLCLVATCGVVAGHHRQLWVVIPAGSVAAQTHLGYVLLVAALVSLTAASLVFDVVRRSGADRRTLVRGTIPIGVFLGLLAWIGPILDLRYGSGNLIRLARSQSSAKQPAGLDHGIDMATEMTSLPPRWLMGRAGDRDLSDVSTLRIALSIALVVAVIGVVVAAFRRRDRAMTSLGVVALVSLAVATATSARMVDPLVGPYFEPENALLYRLFWWPVGVVFALAFLRGVAAPAALAALRRVPPATRPRLAFGAMAVSTVGLVVLARSGHVTPSPQLEPYFEHEIVNAEAIEALPGSPGTVVLRFVPETDEQTAATRPSGAWDTGPFQRYGYAENLVAQLRLRGIEVRFADEPFDGITFSLAHRDQKRATGTEPVELLYLVGPDATERPPAGYRRISTSGTGSQASNGYMVPTAVYVRSSGL